MINLQSVLNVLSLMLNHSGWMLVMQVAWPSVWFRSTAISPSPYFRTLPYFPPPALSDFSSSLDLWWGKIWLQWWWWWGWWWWLQEGRRLWDSALPSGQKPIGLRSYTSYFLICWSWSSTHWSWSSTLPNDDHLLIDIITVSSTLISLRKWIARSSMNSPHWRWSGILGQTSKDFQPNHPTPKRS